MRTAKPCMDATSNAEADADEAPAVRTDDTAHRLMSLFFMFHVATRPLSTEEVVAEADAGYGSGNADSDGRKFRRDRETLAQHGIFIEEIHPDGTHEAETAQWQLNRERTYAARGGISADDASVALAAIDQTFSLSAANPARWPLLRAYLKLAEAAGVTGLPTSVHHTAYNPTMQTIWSAFTARRPVKMTYVNAHGERRERIFETYGTLLRGTHSYLVGRDRPSGEIRTFRCDRIERAKRLPEREGTYEIPTDFAVRTYQFLPFDFANNPPIPATFTIPAAVDVHELELLTQGRGKLDRASDMATWHIEVRDVHAAAVFALEHASLGMRPVAPSELVQSWRDLITATSAKHTQGARP